MKLEGLDLASAALRGAGANVRSGGKASAVYSDFAAKLGELVRGADADQKIAEQNAADLAADRGDVVETMVALSKAELSLRTVSEVRNRALEAFNEIMRLQV